MIKQIVIGAAVLVAVLFIVYLFFSRDSESKQLNNLMKVKEVRGESTYTASEYNAFAEQIKAKLDGLNLFDSGKTLVLGIMGQMRTERDLMNLEAAFGIREGESLGAWLEDDGLLEDVHQKLRSMGYSYRFSIVAE